MLSTLNRIDPNILIYVRQKRCQEPFLALFLYLMIYREYGEGP